MPKEENMLVELILGLAGSAMLVGAILTILGFSALLRQISRERSVVGGK